jgi:hypothetical protein
MPGAVNVALRWVRAGGSATVDCAIGNASAVGLQAAVTGPSAPTITSPAFLVAGTVDTVYPTTTFTATGTAPITWSVTAGTLPAGMAFSSAGVLSGTPTATASGSITFTATNALGADSRALTLTVITASSIPPEIKTNTLAIAVIGQPYTEALKSTGGAATTWSLADGVSYGSGIAYGSALPTGLSFDAATGLISGTPTAGAVTVEGYTVRATNESGYDEKLNMRLEVLSTPY